MSLEIYRKIELENEFERLVKEGKTREEAASILMNEDNLIDTKYVIESYLMPIDEITSEIKRYDLSNPKLDEIEFINNLCSKYNVDRKAIVERIREVRVINKQKEIGIEESLRRLKNKRDVLQREKDKLNNKEMDTEEKSMFYFGLGMTTIVGGFLFYSNPVIVGIIPIVYAASIPNLRLKSLYKKEINLVNELVDLGKEIEYLEKKSDENKQEVYSEEMLVEKNISKYTYDIENFVSHFEIDTVEDKKSIEGPTLVKRRK